MDKNEIIEKLKVQHRELQQTLHLAHAYAVGNDREAAQKCFAQLSKFRTEIAEHLSLENGVFYPDYILLKTARGESIEGTKKFIAEMDVIAKTALSFLDMYNSPEIISSAFDAYRAELQIVTSAINIRIEVEEDGVFGAYLVM